MKTLFDFFKRMHDVDFPYVVLRGFEEFPNLPAGHGDIDILVYNYIHWKELFPDVVLTDKLPRVRHKLPIQEVNYYVDVRYVGDGYYPATFENELIDTREYDNKGFFKPEYKSFLAALAYHVVHHKGVNTYQQYLGDFPVTKYLESLKKSDIGYSIPEDFTVGRFNQYWKGATAIVSAEGDKVIKKQTSWLGYNLIDNEARVLEGVESRHFPKVKKVCETIEIDNCGDRLVNYPEDWEQQFREILEDLKRYDIKHRDIQPANLMIKNGVIKLIDFGWASRNGIGDKPPACLNLNYRPSDGFDDLFSLRKIAKEHRNKLEELAKGGVQ